ncbi:MAG: hypothetical protein ACJ8F7_18935 [Gemmataceae bacterium]
MTRRVLAVLGCTALAFVLSVRAQPPAKPAAGKTESKTEEVSPEKLPGYQDAAAREYKQFEDLLLRLAQRMEKSPLPEDRKKAEALRAAIDLANKSGVENRFGKLLTTLLGKEGNGRGLTTDDLEKAAGQNEELIKILRDMLELLMTDSETLRRKAEVEKLTELIKRIDGLIRQEKVLQAQTDGNRVDSKNIQKEQKKVTQATESIHRAMGPPKPNDAKPGDQKPGDPKPGDPKPGDPKPGDPKPGSPKPGDPKPGDPKPGSPKPGDPKPGDPKPGDPQDQKNPPQPELPGKPQVQKAIEHQKNVEKELEKNKREDASKELDKVIENLEQAKKELEKRLKQLREEELLQLLANLQGRCEKMLAIQIEVFEGTKRVYAVIQTYPDKKPQRGEEQRSQQLSTREGDIVKEANRALKLLEAEGSAVVFAMAMEGVRDDAKSVEKRLDKYDTADTTQQTEQSIIEQLKDMIEALKKAQQQIKDNQNKPPPPNNSPPPPKGLLDLLAELKLIRTMQVQINNRTKQQAGKYVGEQTDDALLQEEITNLSKRQVKIEEKLKNIATGKNQ